MSVIAQTQQHIQTPDTPTTTIQVQPTISPARIYTDIASNSFGVVLGLGLVFFVLWRMAVYLDMKTVVRALVESFKTSYAVIQSNSELIKKHSELMDKQQNTMDKQEMTLSKAIEALHRVEDMIDELRDDLEKSGELKQFYPPEKRGKPRS